MTFSAIVCVTGVSIAHFAPVPAETQLAQQASRDRMIDTPAIRGRQDSAASQRT